MPYIGNQPGTGVRSRFIYTATASQTTFSGADDNSKTLKYADSAYVDVFLNGVCLVPGTDYTASTKTSVVLVQAASVSDILEVVAYDIASMDDSISASSGGTFNGDLGITNASPNLTLTNNTTEDTDGGRESTVTFKGLQSGGEESTLAEIRASHDATADDEKGDLIFKTNDGSDGASPTEAMRIDSAQNVGIGTSSPVRNFHLHEAASSTPVVLAMSTNGTGATTGDGFNISIDGSSSAVNLIQRENADMQFYTNGGTNERMRLDSAGRVGIGTVPNTNMHVSTFPGTLALGDQGVVFGNADSLQLGNNYYWDGSAFKYLGTGKASRNYYNAGTVVWDTTNSSGSANGALTLVERMRLNQYGYLGIGRNDPVQRLDVTAGTTNQWACRLRHDGFGGVNYLLDFDRNGGSIGSVTGNGSNVAYNTSSDYRLKENIVDLDGATARLKQLQPRRFNFIDNDSLGTIDGFIAHEAQTVVPEAVTGTKDAMTEEVLYVDGDEIPEGKKVGDVKTASTIKPQGIDQAKIVPLLTAALKEAIAKIETLETKVAALEAG